MSTRFAFLSRSTLLPVRAALFAAAFVAALASSEAEAQAEKTQATLVLVDPAFTPAATSDLRLSLGTDLLRAKRTARAGGFLVGIGAVGTLASTVGLYRSSQQICPIEDLFCDNSWMRGMAALSGIVAGVGVTTVGLVTLSVGVARRNRIERSLAIGAGAGTFDLRLSF